MKKSKKDIKQLENILKGPRISRVLSQQDLITIKQATEIMRKQLGEAKKKRENHKIWATNSEKWQVKEALNCLLRIAINEPIVPIFKNLVKKFIAITSDWNKNVAEELEIQKTISTLKRFIDYHLTVIDAVQSLKTLLKRVEKVQKFTPPAFELSRHYLKSLQEFKPKRKTNKRLTKRERS